MAKLNDDILQRYHDGELSRRKARQVVRQLEGSTEDRARLGALDEMGELLRESVQQLATEADLSRIWDGVRTGLAAQPAPLSLGQRISRWFAGYRLMAAASAGAAAVATVLMLAPFSAEAPRDDCVIESLEVGPDAVSTIFTIEDPEESGETTVIWVTDETSEGGS